MSIACSKAFTLSVSGVNPPLAWFKMEEAGNADRIDTVNGIPINAGGSAGMSSGAGKIGNAAKFAVVGGQDAALFGDGVSFGFPLSQTSGVSIVCWVNWNAYDPSAHLQIGSFQIFGPAPAFDTNFDLRLNWDASTLSFTVSLFQHGFPTLSRIVLFTPTLGTWYLVHYYYDGATGKVGVSINNAAATESIGNTPLFNLPFDSSLNDMFLSFGPSTVLIDEYGIFPYKLNAAQVTYLYNGGVGKQWPFSLPP